MALGKALEKIVREAAKKRKTSGNNQYSEPSEKFTEASKGDTRDKIGKAIGMRGPTYQRAKAIIRDDPEALAMWRDLMTGSKGRPVKNEQSDNTDSVSIKPTHGNSREYTANRLVAETGKITDACNAGNYQVESGNGEETH